MGGVGRRVHPNTGRRMQLTDTLFSALMALTASASGWNVLLEAAGWMALAFVKFLVTPASALAAGVDPVWAFAYSAGGAAAGLVAMQPMAKAMFRWWSRRRRERGKRTFTLGRRRLVGIKLRFGLLGIAAISGIIGVPVAGLVAFKYFGHERRTLPVLVVAYVLWSAILTLLASTALI